jgi:hypothetical protein
MFRLTRLFFVFMYTTLCYLLNIALYYMLLIRYMLVHTIYYIHTYLQCPATNLDTNTGKILKEKWRRKLPLLSPERRQSGLGDDCATVSRWGMVR